MDWKQRSDAEVILEIVARDRVSLSVHPRHRTGSKPPAVQQSTQELERGGVNVRVDEAADVGGAPSERRRDAFDVTGSSGKTAHPAAASKRHRALDRPL
jgi:hypothetical protein